jgi:glycosyltransferase involved in cell wall biosynthesis
MAKIALIGPVYPYRGDIAHYTTLLDRALRNAGRNVLLISFRRQYPSWIFPGRSDKDPSEEPIHVEEANYWIDSINPITWLQTFRRVRKFSPDLLILQWWITFWAPVWLTLMALNRIFLKCPVLIVCHNVLPHETRRYDILLAKLTLRLATHLIVQSEEEQARLLALAPSASSTIAPLPMFDMFVHQGIEQSEARAALGLSPDEPILLFFGIVRPYKGLPELIRALPAVRQSVNGIRLVIAGEFWEDKDEYLQLIDELALNDMIVIDDRYIPNEEVAVYFSAADALAAPYRFKTGSGVSQLANAFGLPVITVPAEDVDAASVQPTRTERVKQVGTAVIEFFEAAGAIDDACANPKIVEDSTDPTWDLLLEIIERTAGGSMATRKTDTNSP